MKHKESQIQQASVQWFRLVHRDLAPCFFSIPNGMLTSASQARIAVAEGLTKGVADTFLAIPRGKHHGFFIEFKQDRVEWRLGREHHTRTYQRPEQREWQAAIEAQGYRYAVVRTFDEFKETITEYLKDEDNTGQQ